ncbi:DNA replication and repair protein RecF [Candidatus Saccharibacteria bacterium]|nr:DNA replication and repair protein RecF [Candidatus Saccharibacteria bacterium]
MRGILTDLELHYVRSHTSAQFQFAHDMNAIVGPNGSGKTTLLEALYTLLRGTSFKGPINELVQYGQPQMKMSTTLTGDRTKHQRSLKVQLSESAGLRKWSIDNKNHARLPLAARLPVVLFEPELSRLVTGSPQRRRDYLDHIAAQLDIEVATEQNKYVRILKQRNQLLKSLRDKKVHNAPPDLFIWNTQLAHSAESVVKARTNVIEKLQERISDHYRGLGGTDDIVLLYASDVSKNATSYASKLLQYFESSLMRDIALGHTSFGPHRDDLVVHLASQPATERASRGEVRTIVVALKMLETQLLSERFKPENISPILLLDDVLSELDLSHQERVLDGLKDHQVFITTTDAHALTPQVHTIFLESPPS